MKTKHLCTVAALMGCLTSMNIYAQQRIVACNGKTYGPGDTLVVGKAAPSGYLVMREVEEQGHLNTVDREGMPGLKMVITEVPEYDQNLYESFGIFERPETPQLVKTKAGDREFYISLNDALSRGNIMSDYKVSSMEGAVDLNPSILYVYTLKLYQIPVDEKVVDTYASLCDSEAFAKVASDPFALDDLRQHYRTILQQALEEADFSRIFRLKCWSELSPYDMEKGGFPLSDFYFMEVRTNQRSELSQLHYYLWEECAFRLTNEERFTFLPSDKQRAKGFYSMQRYAGSSPYQRPMATLYVYVKIKEQPVKLPEKEVMVTSHENRFGWSTLNKVYGKKSLDMDIIRVDGYHDLISYVEGEVVYNYLGSILP